MSRRTPLVTLSLLACAALVAVGAAAGAQAKKGKPSLSATPVFKVHLKPSQEVPRVTGLKADAIGHVTFDLERSPAGAITSGEVIFYLNYSFPGTVTLNGLHVHAGAKGTAGPPVIDSGLTASPIVDADGQGNVTRVVTTGFTPATLQAILDNPRGYYVNLHTSTHPAGAVRDQLHNPKKR
ncbi:MAG TPA: CHRD domain-containing protein [Gaiellaceae bacterium]|nr:CHRD domain-containing protein [Gaiellaceae bacterium]